MSQKVDDTSALKAYRSPDGRIKTDIYQKDGNRFCIAELTQKGVLITEFNHNFEVLSQTYSKNREIVEVLAAFIGENEMSFVDVDKYTGVEMRAKCSKCANVGLIRELDTFLPEKIGEIPVVPIFICKNCKQKHYCLTDEYLRTLVSSNKHLFESKELEEIETKPEVSINELKEYIIRIFASKRISRAKLE